MATERWDTLAHLPQAFSKGHGKGVEMSKPNLERGKCKKRELSPRSQEYSDQLFMGTFVRIPMPYWQLMTDSEAKVLAYLWGLRDMYEMTEQLTRSGEFFCTAKTMEAALQIPRSTQHRILKSLELRGYVKVETRGMPAKRFIKINRCLIVADVAATYSTDAELIKRFRSNPRFQRKERKKHPTWGQFG